MFNRNWVLCSRKRQKSWSHLKFTDGFEPATFWLWIQCSNHYTIESLNACLDYFDPFKNTQHLHLYSSRQNAIARVKTITDIWQPDIGRCETTPNVYLQSSPKHPTDGAFKVHKRGCATAITFFTFHRNEVTQPLFCGPCLTRFAPIPPSQVFLRSNTHAYKILLYPIEYYDV